VGVYFQSDGKWVDVPPEVVNWKTGGVLKNVGTLGVVKGDVNGKIKSGTSRTHLLQPIELLVYAPDGTAITEYQLIKLRTHSDSREFRTVTGGVFHASGGAERDTLEFTSKHIAQRTWTIPLGDLKPGEYGLLPPGMGDARSASAQLGKIYSVSIPEYGGSGSVETITPIANKTQSNSPTPQSSNSSSRPSHQMDLRQWP
jgi:hypothetical protein